MADRTTNKNKQAPARAAARAGVLAAQEAIVEDAIRDADDAKKHGKVIPRDTIGRPTVMTNETFRKLEYAFKIGCPYREAANYAGIGLTTLTAYLAKHPDYREQVQAWQDDYLVTFARGNVAAAITGQQPKGNVPISQDYLRAKRKDEFAEKNITEHQAVLTPAEVEANATKAFADSGIAQLEAGSDADDDDEDHSPTPEPATPPPKNKAK